MIARCTNLRVQSRRHSLWPHVAGQIAASRRGCRIYSGLRAPLFACYRLLSALQKFLPKDFLPLICLRGRLRTLVAYASETINTHQTPSTTLRFRRIRRRSIRFHHVLIKPIEIPGGELLKTPSEQVEIAQEESFVQGLSTEGRETCAAGSSIIATVKSDITNDGKVSSRFA